MGTENVIKIMKEIHPDRVLLVRIGTFYHQYGKDACIMSYLFGYQMKVIDKNLYTCGFPKSGLNKVLAKLEENSISYMLINKSENYEVQEENEFKNDNKYMECYNKAHKYITKKNKIDAIYNYLLENINDINIKEKINKVEEILYEI